MTISEFPRGGGPSDDYDEGFRAAVITPPQDLVAEQSVLGAMMLSKDAIADVVETLVEADFYKPAHASVYGSIIDLYGRGEPADAITVAGNLSKLGTLNNIGGAAYLHTLVASVPTAANAEYYARIVSEKATLRRLVEAGTRITQSGYAGNGDIDKIVDRAQAEIFDVTNRRTKADYLPLADIIHPALEEVAAIEGRGGQSVGIPTGIQGLDAITHGLHPGQLVIVAARPGMGKSTLGMDFARAVSIKNNMTSAFFSLEMGRNEIVMRLLSAETGVHMQAIRGGQMSDAEWERVARRVGQISSAPLFIDDSPNMTMMEIRAKARRLKQRHDLKLLVIDYMQLMTSGRRVESRQVEVSEFSRSLKLLAKELEVPVIALSQLNRGPEQRQDKKPMLSDLRESGSLEQDADMVVLIHREDTYDQETRRGEADLILAKHRNGPTGVIPVLFQGHYSRFTDMAAV